MISTNNTTTFNAIANQYPLIGGTGVYNARVIINSYYPTIEFDSDSTCQIAGFRTTQPESQQDNVSYEQTFIYPNPFSNFFNINAPVGSICTVYDLLGIIRYSFVIYRTNEIISANQLSAGIYFLNINSNGINYKVKIIKH